MRPLLCKLFHRDQYHGSTFSRDLYRCSRCFRVRGELKK